MTQTAAGLSILSNQVSFADSASVDAFSRVRTSHPVTLFAAQCRYDAEPLLFEAGATGTGVTPTHNTDTRLVSLSCTSGSGTSFLQSYEYVPYQAGKSQLILMTGLLDTAVAGAVVDVGAFDAANGIFLRQNGTTNLQWVRRTSTSGSVVDNAVAQSSWNIDKFDGTGVSGLTLDVTKVFIIVIDAQFLGMGRVRVGFDINGMIYWAHQFLHANVLTLPYMQTLTLPIQMLVTATATASTKTSYFKCASVSSEGGLEKDFIYQFATPEQAVTAASGTSTPIISMRPRTTFNGIRNNVKLVVQHLAILVTGSNPIMWELAIGCSFSVAPTFSNVDATHSAFEYSSAPGTHSAMGTVIARGYVAASNQAKDSSFTDVGSRYPITLDRAGAVRANGTLSVFVTGIGGTSVTRAAVLFGEIR